MRKSGGVLQRDEDHEAGVGADNGLLGVEVVALGVRVVLNHVLDVEDLVGLLRRDGGEGVGLGDVLAQVGVDPRQRIGRLSAISFIK